MTGRRVSEILNGLDDANVHYDEIVIKKATLEDVFLRSTDQEFGGGGQDD